MNTISAPKNEFLNECYLRAKAQESFYEFIKQSWPITEGGVRFVDGWHVQAMAEHLEAVLKRDIHNLMIHVPPRSSKTTIVSVDFPAWAWIHRPHEKFMYASYAHSLSMEHSLKCRRLIESDWYQKRWGDTVSLACDQNAKGFFENTSFGYRISTSVGASATGKGGSILVCDDPNEARDSGSEVKRESTNLWWDLVWSTRLNDPKNDARVVVQQRLHHNDVSGHILSKDNDKEWTNLILPMEFDESRHCRTFINGKTWEDPRKKNGELLCPERFGEKEVARLKVELGSYGFSGQCQQSPSPDEGGIIQKGWFKLWKSASPPELSFVVQSWDTALEAGEHNAYSACTTWGVFKNKDNVPSLILLGLWRGRVEYPELRLMAQRLYKDYRDDGEIVVKPDGKHRPDMVLVEAKVSGISLIQDMIRAGIPAIRFNPNKYGDKEQRVRLITPLIESGRVFLPASISFPEKPMKFCDVFVKNCAEFPKGESRDLVDTMTQVLIRLNSSGWISHPLDESLEDSKTKTKASFY